MKVEAYVHVAHVSMIHAAVVHTAMTHVSVIHVWVIHDDFAVVSLREQREKSRKSSSLESISQPVLRVSASQDGQTTEIELGHCI